MASRLIDLISKKTNCTCSTVFLLKLAKNKFARAARFFGLSLAVALHDYNAVLYD